MTMIHASLFSGIGGAELAASWMGWDNIFHCEINPFGRKVLDYWFPKSKSYEDITKTDFKEWRGKVDVLTGGFPCQPFSQAGKRGGDTDDRYLWPEMLRVIREIQPTWVVGENVAGITSMVESGEDVEMGSGTDIFDENIIYRKEQEFTIERICKDFEREGYSVQPIVIPACAVGAPHRRDRVWFIARRGEGFVTNATSHGGYRIPASSSEETGRPNGEKAEQFAKRRKIRAITHTESPRSKGKLLERPSKIQSFGQDSRIIQPDWRSFPTKSPICCGNDGISDRSHGETISKKHQMDRTDMIVQCLREGRIETDPDTGRIYSRMIRGREGELIELKGSECNGYLVHSLKYHGIKKQVRAHQVIWISVNGTYDKSEFQIDHINRDRKDNRIENLRLVTAKQNVANSTRFDGRFTDEEKDQMFLLHHDGHMSFRELAEHFGCSKSRVHQIFQEHKFNQLDGITFPKWRAESIKAYGNAWVPQVAYEIFKAISNTTQ